MNKKYFLFLILTLLSTGGCGYSAMPNFINGKYYMAGDDNCRQSRQNLYDIMNDTIQCLDKDGNYIEHRSAMTDQQLEMWKFNQQMQQLQQAQFNQQMSDFNRNMQLQNINNQLMMMRYGL